MHIYCINLEKRGDRRKTSGVEFAREGLDVEFFPATDGRINAPSGLSVRPSEYGCTMSHTRVWRDMIEKGYETALVFEDDVRLILILDQNCLRLWRMHKGSSGISYI
jgi:glycosyl transferase family 25